MAPTLGTFSIPTKIVFGDGAAAEAGRALAGLGARKVLVVSDRGLVKAGLIQPLCGALEQAGLAHAAFVDVEANPSVETVEACLEAYRSQECDGILAVGGGSPMDTAKAAGILATNPGGIRSYEGVGKVGAPIPPLVAIPTTVGTGSEVTYFAVVTDPVRQFKMPIISPLLAPRVALLDPLMVAGLRAGLVATTGMDALTHAVEAYLSKLAQPFSDAQALQAVEMIGANLIAAVRGDRTARGMLLYASCLAGMAFTMARLGVCHALAHPLGGVCGVPHGAANAVLLPHAMAFNRPNAEARLGRLAVALGLKIDTLTPAEASEAAVAEVRRLATEAGIAMHLRDMGVTEDAIPRMAADAITSGNCAINPRPITLEHIVELYRQAL